MRAEIKRLQRSLGITAVLVTHDQTEALSMADRIPVLREERLQLVNTACGFVLPATTWAALERGPHGAARYTLGLRPENILLQPYPDEPLLPATMTLPEPLGRAVLLSVTCGPHRLKVL